MTMARSCDSVTTTSLSGSSTTRSSGEFTATSVTAAVTGAAPAGNTWSAYRGSLGSNVYGEMESTVSAAKSACIGLMRMLKTPPTITLGTRKARDRFDLTHSSPIA